MSTAAAYRPDIDGLRAISVVLVVLFHAVPEVMPGGFIGVDVFFVISGYLISGILQRELNAGRFSLWLFFARRVRRILPAMVVVTLATWAVVRLLGTPDDFVALGKHLMAAAGFVSNYVLWREAGYFDAAASTKPLLHFWSLAVEEQFYLLWPLLMWLAFRAAKTRGLFATACALTLVSFLFTLASPVNASFSFYAYPTRAWELGLGAILALSPVPSAAPRLRLWASLGGLALLAGGVLRVHTEQAWAVVPTLGATALLWAGPAAVVNRLLALKPMVWLGLLSYPLYLWHWPLLALGHTFGSQFTTTSALWSLVAALVLSLVTHAALERPIQRGLRLDFEHVGRARLTVAAGLLVLMGIGVIGYLSTTEALFTERLMTLRGVLGRPGYTWLSYRKGLCFLGPDDTSQVFSDGCRTPVIENTPRVLLWGDSYAASLSPSLDAAVTRVGGSMVSYSAAACAPILDTQIEGRPQCTHINNFVFEQIRQDHFSTVVLVSNWWIHVKMAAAPSLQAIDSTIARLHQAGVTNVIVVGQFPVWQADLARLVMREIARTKRTPESSTQWLEPGIFTLGELLEARYHPPNAQTVAPLKISCPQNNCGIRIGRALWTFDNGHPTREAADLYVEQIMPFVK